MTVGRTRTVAICGAGFAGLRAASVLARRGRGLRVVLIDRRSDSEFAPLYPDLISGRVGPGGLRYPLAPFCRRRGITFRQAGVRGIERGHVETDAGPLEADFVLVTLGCRTNWFGNDKASRHGIGLKSVAQGLRIRCEIIEHDRLARHKGRPFEILVVGGGYTGFETASHSLHLLHTIAAAVDGRPTGRVRIIEQASEPLRMVAPSVRQWATRLVESIGIRVETAATIDTFGDDGSVVLSTGETVDNALVLWTAGVTPVEPAARIDVATRDQKRLAVDEHLHLEGRETVFAAGDVAAPLGRGRKDVLRMSVQFSLSGGQAAAENILRQIDGRPLKTFAPADPGYVVPLAHHAGAGRMPLVGAIHGRVPFVLHYVMSVFRSWGWRNRLALLGDLAGLGPSPVHQTLRRLGHPAAL